MQALRLHSYLGFCLVIACWFAPASVRAQREADAPKMQVVTLTTRDNVAIKVDYYPTTLGKESIVVMLLHDFGGSSKDLAPFAQQLQKNSRYAVVVPNLRGHGDAAAASGIKPESLRSNDFAAMVGDLEAVKRFLLEENNKEKLNVENLAVVASGMSTVVAVRWAVLDWSYPQLPGLKQGQDVKALALVSPMLNFEGCNAQDAYRTPVVSQGLSIDLIYGEKAKEAKDMRKIAKFFEVPRKIKPPKPKRKGKEDEPETPPPSNTDYRVLKLDSDIHGIGLLISKNLSRRTQGQIEQFLKQRVEETKKPWAQRKG